MDLHLADCFKKKSLEATQKIMAYYYYTNKALVYHIVSITHYCISNITISMWSLSWLTIILQSTLDNLNPC